MQLGPTAIHNSATRPIEICCLPLDEVYDVLKCVEKYLRCTKREGIMSRKKHLHWLWLNILDAPCAALPFGSAGRRHDEPQNLDWQFIAVPKHFENSWPPHQESRASIFHQWAFKRIEMCHEQLTKNTVALMGSQCFFCRHWYTGTLPLWKAIFSCNMSRSSPGHVACGDCGPAMIWPRAVPEQG